MKTAVPMPLVCPQAPHKPLAVIKVRKPRLPWPRVSEGVASIGETYGYFLKVKNAVDRIWFSLKKKQ